MAKKKFKKRSTKKKVMATKKRRKKTTLSAGRSKGVKKRKTTRRKKRRMLSDMFTPMSARTTVKTAVGGGIGGFALITAENMGLDNLTPGWKGATILGMAGAAGMMGQLNICAGIAGAGAYKMIKERQVTMSEDAGMANYTRELAQLPMFLDEDNNPMNLSEGEYFLSEGMMDLSENMYGIPNYGPRY